MVILMKIGDRIRLIREQRGLTRQQLAEKIGTSVGIIYFYEKNRKIPSAEILKRIAEAFNVSTDYLLGLTDDPTPNRGELPAFIKERLKKLENIEQKNYPQRLREIAEMLNRIADELEGKEENR